jgi:D-3-phosphoglycerate dehydrogenase / 2-oxoglutarate reductase
MTRARKVLLLEGIHPVAKAKLQEHGLDVTLLPQALPERELVEALKGMHAVGIRSKTQLTRTALESADSLLVVGAFCIGTNQIALDPANRLGVPVFNAPYSNTRSVAELVLAEIIALSRKLVDNSQKTHAGEWLKSASGSHEVRNKTLGIIGYGHIGSQLSVLAEALGLDVLYYDIVKKLPLGNAESVDTMDELLQRSDFVTLHVPETRDTKDMMGAKEIARMKKGSYLINASRGTVVVIPALAEALRSGHLSGAAIDVYPVEPSSTKERFTSELQGLPNVILTPHVGGSTEEAQEAIGHEVSHSLIRYLEQGATLGAVNFPIVDPPLTRGRQRILNVHHNVPGVLRAVNTIVSDVGANIEGQYLSTDSNIGYLVMDLAGADASKVSERIAKLETSIKTRLVT